MRPRETHLHTLTHTYTHTHRARDEAKEPKVLDMCDCKVQVC